MSGRCETFRTRLLERATLAGTFLKTPSPIIAEVLGLSALDVVCIDAEHAPFGRLETDSVVAALRAADMPSLVRIGSDSPADIRNALDAGASGIVVPHVTSAVQAARIVKATRFGEGGRGFAGSPRAARYATKTMQDHLADSAKHTSVVVQIEDLAALPEVADIAAVDGVDALFIGRTDLAVAMGKTAGDDAVADTVGDICNTGARAGATVGMFTPNTDEIPRWIKAGASLFLLSSDQSFILGGAARLVSSVKT
ncbi:MAG: aldolase/citrate lyase family protein [Pseudomonadota bacterium]